MFSCRSLLSHCFIGLAILVSSCSPPEIKDAAPAINKVKAGEKFMIILPENHAEFFIWKLKDDKGKTVECTNSVWHGNEKGVYYFFTASQIGQDTLNFTLYKYNELQKTTSYIVKVE